MFGKYLSHVSIWIFVHPVQCNISVFCTRNPTLGRFDADFALCFGIFLSVYSEKLEDYFNAFFTRGGGV